MIKMREGDKVTEVTTREALVRSTITTGLKGNARSQGLALDLISAADRQNAAVREAKRELWMRIKAHQAQLLEAARSAGEDESKILPHPDDIIEDDLKGYRLIGPIDEVEQRRLNKTIAYRDALIMQDALDQRLTNVALRGKRSTSKSGDKARAGDIEPATEQSGALLMAMTLDHQVPERYRLDTTAIIMRQFKLDRLTRRELFKAVYNAWKALGCKVKRGQQFVSQQVAKDQLSLTFALLSAHRSGEIDLEAIASGEPDEYADELFERYTKNG